VQTTPESEAYAAGGQLLLEEQTWNIEMSLIYRAGIRVANFTDQGGVAETL
jgi:hypothetical protein